MSDSNNTPANTTPAPVRFTHNGVSVERPVHNGGDGADACNCLQIKGALAKGGLKARVHCVSLNVHRDKPSSWKHEYNDRHSGAPSYQFDGVKNGRSYVVVPNDFRGDAAQAKAITAQYEAAGIVDVVDDEKVVRKGRASAGDGEATDGPTTSQKHLSRVASAVETLVTEMERYKEVRAFPQNSEHIPSLDLFLEALAGVGAIKDALSFMQGIEMSWAPPRIDPTEGAVCKLLPGESAAFRAEQEGMLDDKELQAMASEAVWVLRKLMPDGRRFIAEAQVGATKLRRALTIGDFLVCAPPTPPAQPAPAA